MDAVFSNFAAERKWRELMIAVDEAPVVVPCTNTDPELWFPAKADDEQHTDRYTVARKLCKVCPVRELCLEYALTANEMHGMWGGLTPRERRTMRLK